MINVGFIINYRLSGWLGVSNYYKNFLNSINNIKNSKIKPIIITDYHFTKNEKLFFKGVKIIKTHLVDRKSRGKKIINNLLISIFGRNIFLDNFLKKNNINIISHTSYLGKNSNIISLKWFPDFQEIHLPELFNSKQILARSYDIKMAAKHSTKIIISSTSVKNDLKKINNQAYEKGLIFKHVNEIIKPEKLKNYHYLKKKYSLKKKYFFLPNHFWTHKNHVLILQSLIDLKKNNKIHNIQIICTGLFNDYRNPNHKKKIIKIIKNNKLENNFRILGVVNFDELMSLMKYSVAVINPSKSEGWSSTVEQAKSMGKFVLLSDLPVHKEQNPDRSFYFKVSDHLALSQKLYNLNEKFSYKKDNIFIKKSFYQTKYKKKKFILDYEKIVKKVIHESNKSN